MEYSIKEQSDIEAVVVKASGIINTTVAERMVIDAGCAIKIAGFRRCLFDLVETEVDPNQTLTGMFMFVDAFNRAGIDKSVRMAALYVSGGPHRLHLEESAKFEGFKLKHFLDRDEAEKWLRL